MASMQDVYTWAHEIVTGNGEHAPRLKIALWAAILSSRNDLENNGKQLDNLRAYLDGGLPLDVASVQAIIGAAPARLCTPVQADAVMRVERMERAGELVALERKPGTLAEWLAWRRTVAHFHGMAWKTASFAALLMWPFDAPFVPVDSHVCGRLGRMDLYTKISSKSKPAYRRYRTLERMVYLERKQACASDPIALWHWYKWEEHRAIGGAGEQSGSHLLLSPYYY